MLSLFTRSASIMVFDAKVLMYSEYVIRPLTYWLCSDWLVLMNDCLLMVVAPVGDVERDCSCCVFVVRCCSVTRRKWLVNSKGRVRAFLCVVVLFGAGVGGVGGDYDGFEGRKRAGRRLCGR